MRRKTRQIHVGNVLIGGDAPIAVQSMTTMYTRDVDATVAQIHRLEEVGCEIVRVAVPEEEDALALGAIKQQIHIPLVADIHYNGKLALMAIEQGVDCVRINPGNLLHGREMFTQIVEAAKQADIAMRIGVNSGSIDALDRGPEMRKVSVKLLDDGTFVKSRSRWRSAAANARSSRAAWWRRRWNTAAGPTTWATRTTRSHSKARTY